MQKTSEAEFFIKLIEGNVWALVDLEDRIKVRYVDYQDNQFFVLNVNHQRGLTLRIISMIDSSDEEASFLTERNAAIRMLSLPLDHKLRHFWQGFRHRKFLKEMESTL
jgi:hypothetical protein